MEDMRDYVEIGDRITYTGKYDGVERMMIVNSINFLPKPEDSKIIKIERPTYETVKEVKKEEKKELLTEDEKKYLNRILGFIDLDNKIQTIRFLKYFDNDNDENDYVVIRFCSDLRQEFEITCHDYRFDGVEEYERYSKIELGL